MELIAKMSFYRCGNFEIYEGQSTADLKVKLTEERKRELLQRFPDGFEAVPEEKKKAVELFETPEEKLVIETSEKRIGKLRTK